MAQITMNELQKVAADYSADCVDAKADLNKFVFAEDNRLQFNTGEYGMQGTLNDWAFMQICWRMNVPAGWVGNPQSCPEPLKIQIMNELASVYRDNSNHLIRMKGEVIRAILSSQYSPFDNVQFIDLVAEAVSTMGIEPKVQRYTLDDDLRSYIVFPQVTFAPDPQAQPGQDDGGLHPALYISNSERGGGSTKVVGAVFRSICTNGMIFGWSEEETFKVQHRFHSQAMMGALVADGITLALKMSEEATVKFIASQDKKVPAVSLGGIVNTWAEKYGITVEAKDNWMAAITTESITNGRLNDVRLFDVINAATYIAQTQEGVMVEKIERMAGEILKSA
jgi:hypothetical protein